MKLPIISLAILGGQAFAAYTGGATAAEKLNVFASFYTGFDFINRAFHPEALLIGYGPWVAKRFLLPIARPRLGGAHLPISLS